MPTASELLTAAATASHPVLRGIGDEQLDLPTPCAEFAVRDVVGHLFHVVIGFQALAAKQLFDFTSTPDYLTGAWRERYPRETARLAAVWADPAALEGVSPGMGMPQETVAQLVLLDLTVHSWDLAVATGQSFQPDHASVQTGAQLVAALGGQAQEMGVFGPPVAAPAAASDFGKLLGATGRDPSWTR